MANAAANSGRANIILDPFPSLVDPENPNKLALDPKVRIVLLDQLYIQETIDPCSCERWDNVHIWHLDYHNYLACSSKLHFLAIELLTLNQMMP